MQDEPKNKKKCMLAKIKINANKMLRNKLKN